MLELQRLLETIVCPRNNSLPPKPELWRREQLRLGCDPEEVAVCRHFIMGGGDCWAGGGLGDEDCTYRHICLAGMLVWTTSIL